MARERALDDHHGDRPRDSQSLSRCFLPRTATTSSCSPKSMSWRSSGTRTQNLYERVRALFFLYAIHRFHLPGAAAASATGKALIPLRGYEKLLSGDMKRRSASFSPPEARGTERRAFQRAGRGVSRLWRFRRWPTRCGAVCVRCAAINGCFAPAIRPITRCASARNCCSAEPGDPFPILHEATPVRMDLSHSGWSDIFFLGMDLPEWRAS